MAARCLCFVQVWPPPRLLHLLGDPVRLRDRHGLHAFLHLVAGVSRGRGVHRARHHVHAHGPW